MIIKNVTIVQFKFISSELISVREVAKDLKENHNIKCIQQGFFIIFLKEEDAIMCMIKHGGKKCPETIVEVEQFEDGPLYRAIGQDNFLKKSHQRHII